jgi:hypothetical protein
MEKITKQAIWAKIRIVPTVGVPRVKRGAEK